MVYGLIQREKRREAREYRGNQQNKFRVACQSCVILFLIISPFTISIRHDVWINVSRVARRMHANATHSLAFSTTESHPKVPLVLSYNNIIISPRKCHMTRNSENSTYCRLLVCGHFR